MASSLTFPRATFAKLSPHPFLLANLQPSDSTLPSTRTNGRQPRQARPPQINTSSLSHTEGSAVVRTGDTTVICGVRGEILPISSIPQYRPGGGLNAGQSHAVNELKDYDLLVPNVELATGCAPQFLPGVPPTALAQTLSTEIFSLLHSCNLLSPDDFRIWYTPETARGGNGEQGQEGDTQMTGQDQDEDASAPELMAYWTLYIDLLFISFDGNPLDAAWAAVLAALRATKLPRARWEPDLESVVCSRGEKKQLAVRGMPIACTAAVFQEREHQKHHGPSGGDGKHWVLMDPDRLEEQLCREKITMVVDRSDGGETRVKSLSKRGGTVLGPAFIKEFSRCAEERWEEYRKAMS